MKKPSKYQNAIYKAFQLSDKDINISAVAGSGKTTTLLNLLKFIPDGSSSIFLAFNNSIVDELKDRNERRDVSIMTIHSCGWRSILRRYGKVKMNPNKCIAKIESVLKKFKVLEKKKGYYFYTISKILDLMRCNLIDNEKEDIMKLVNHYNIDFEETDIDLVMSAYNLLISDKTQFDFMDMIFVPLIDKTIRFQKFDYVFCDESQDFSIAQQKFIKSCINRRGRLVTVGDKRQAIYGFAGADSNSYDKLSNINGKAIKLPLSVSYRCAKKIVLEAQKIVPEISYSPFSEDGIVNDSGSLTELSPGDWILCRNLKPLVQTYLWLLKNKIKSKIRGKEIGEGILSLINKTGAKTLSSLSIKLNEEKVKILTKLEKRGVNKPSLHPKMEIFNQKSEVIKFLCEEVSTVDQLKTMIKNIFSDKIKGIILSTIHKSKGLENDRIFFICPELIPSKYAEQDWELEQERNLKYVAITRAKSELIYVHECEFKEDITKKIKLK